MGNYESLLILVSFLAFHSQSWKRVLELLLSKDSKPNSAQFWVLWLLPDMLEDRSLHPQADGKAHHHDWLSLLVGLLLPLMSQLWHVLNQLKLLKMKAWTYHEVQQVSLGKVVEQWAPAGWQSVCGLGGPSHGQLGELHEDFIEDL